MEYMEYMEYMENIYCDMYCVYCDLSWQTHTHNTHTAHIHTQIIDTKNTKHILSTHTTLDHAVHVLSCGGEIHLHGNIPVVLNVLVDHSGNHHGNDCVVPGGYEHERQADSHPQK